MQRAQWVAQRVFAAHRGPWTRSSQQFIRTFIQGSLRLRRRTKNEQDGRSSRLPPSRHRSPVLQYGFRRPLLSGLDQRRDQLAPGDVTAAILLELGRVQEKDDNPDYRNFMQCVVSALNDSSGSLDDVAHIAGSLRRSFVEQGASELRAQIKYAYHGYLANRRLSDSNLKDQARIADIRYPTEWYPKTRQMQRKIHLHVGPTNSGKTYHALKRLEQAESGLYAGPLRLLAHEVYTRLNARGKPCNLVTGDERHIAEEGDVNMSSCTVEMVPVYSDFDVAVIDEIQMIGHEERGWAWTQAVLGLKAKELHLCGEERTIPLIRELAAAMGDDLEVHHYKRLSPLKTMSASLKGDLSSLRKGDCVVAFSKLQIHRLRREIEIRTKKPVAVIYGSLPPEVRTQQAELFNDPSNDYDILVASDAIGMGLNLSIKRIVFATTLKFNGETQVPVDIAQIKQIAGRAGRYRTAAQAATPDANAKDLIEMAGHVPTAAAVLPPAKSLGLVTTLEPGDLSVIRTAMESQADPIMTAGLFPPIDVLVRFAAYFPPSTSFSYIILRLHKASVLHPRFHLCSLKEHLRIADTIEPVKNLTISDRVIFCASPASVKDEPMQPVLRAFAECVGKNGGGGILDINALNLELLNKQVSVGSKEYLQSLECLHKALILYLWLSYRFAGVFTTQGMAFYLKKIVEDRIQQALSKVSTNIRTVARDPAKKIIRKHFAKDFILGDADAEIIDDAPSSGLDYEHSHGSFSNIGGSTLKGNARGQSGIGINVALPDLVSSRQSLARDSTP